MNAGSNCCEHCGAGHARKEDDSCLVRTHCCRMIAEMSVRVIAGKEAFLSNGNCRVSTSVGSEVKRKLIENTIEDLLDVQDVHRSFRVRLIPGRLPRCALATKATK